MEAILGEYKTCFGGLRVPSGPPWEGRGPQFSLQAEEVIRLKFEKWQQTLEPCCPLPGLGLCLHDINLSVFEFKCSDDVEIKNCLSNAAMETDKYKRNITIWALTPWFPISASQLLWKWEGCHYLSHETREIATDVICINLSNSVECCSSIQWSSTLLSILEAHIRRCIQVGTIDPSQAGQLQIWTGSGFWNIKNSLLSAGSARHAHPFQTFLAILLLGPCFVFHHFVPHDCPSTWHL